MRAGRAIRENARDRARFAELCSCGHSLSLHHELTPETLTLVGGEIVVDVNPAYRPLHFHCDHPSGCACVHVG